MDSSLHGTVMKLHATFIRCNPTSTKDFMDFTDENPTKREVGQHQILVNILRTLHMLCVLNRFGISPLEDLLPAGTCAITAAMTYPQPTSNSSCHSRVSPLCHATLLHRKRDKVPSIQQHQGGVMQPGSYATLQIWHLWLFHLWL